MTNRETIIRILSEIKPTKSLVQINDIIEGGYLDSFELLLLISQLMETFSIDIGVDEIAPENFNSIEAMEGMVSRLQQEK